MNAIDMLKTDHKAIRKILLGFDKLEKSDHAGQAETVRKLVTALHSHAAIEEDHFYPAVEKAKAEPKAQVRAANQEHDHMDKMVDELAQMDAKAKGYRAKFDALRAELMHHMREEEQEMFPAAKEAMGAQALGHLGEAMEDEKRQQQARRDG